jgi:hypothetical protein
MKLTIKEGKIYDSEGRPFDTRNAVSSEDFGDIGYMSTQPGTALFTMDREGNIYALLNREQWVTHHNSIQDTSAGSGEIAVIDGVFQSLSDESGHFRPPRFMTNQVVSELTQKGIPVSPAQVKYRAPEAPLAAEMDYYQKIGISLDEIAK